MKFILPVAIYTMLSGVAKKGFGLEIRMTGLWCWFKEHEILKGNEGSTFLPPDTKA